MAATIKNLGEGQLPAAKATLYTCPASTQAVVLNIILVNTDAIARTVNLYYKKSGATSRRILPKDMSMASGSEYPMKEKITMGAGDLIEGDAAAATVVDYVINGVERT